MKKFFQLVFLLVCLLNTITLKAQLYSKAYGNKENSAIIFLHGGPGYNCFSFEGSTAERLVEEGYYVIVFDQRGCGRSENPENSKYDFDEAINDLNSVYEKYAVGKATLIGHSWGGTLGLVFAEQYNRKVSELILVGAPMDYQQTFKAIIVNSEQAYKKQGKEEPLKYTAMLKTMDTTSLAYANYCFMHAMSSGQYSPTVVTPKAKEIKQAIVTLPDASQLRNMTQSPVKGFYSSERYTQLKLYDRLNILSEKVSVYGIYGSDDGLFDNLQLRKIKSAIGDGYFSIVENASHSVFIDQQEMFIELLNKCVKH